MTPAYRVRAATPQDAAQVHAITGAAFAGQERLDPPSGATRETVADVADWITDNGGLVALDGSGALVAAARFSHQDGGFWLRRVAVRHDVQGRGVAGLLIAQAEPEAARLGHREMRVGVRKALAANIAYWQRRGFRHHTDHDFWVELRRPLPVEVVLPTAADTRALGARLASVTRAGDLLVLSGDLGAGKTTLTQGIGQGLGVRGAVTSPTFVIARVHPSLGAGPPLVHADAYRLGAVAEVDDLDLDASLDESVTVVEWGEGKVEDLADDRLEVVVRRPLDDADETRTVVLRAVGTRWADVDLTAVAAGRD
jgi:tRNA threonylcarbamoyladenosine biosynthesis protein TsaE